MKRYEFGLHVSRNGSTMTNIAIMLYVLRHEQEDSTKSALDINCIRNNAFISMPVSRKDYSERLNNLNAMQYVERIRLLILLRKLHGN
jgi:hypothetical protein